jgi:cytidylate kinase
MYRALTWWMLSRDVPVSSPEAVASRAQDPVIEVSTDPGRPAVSVDGTDVTGPIRTREVSNAVSAVASVPEVRSRLVALQQAIIARTCADGAGIVAEGRDIGTVVAPHAAVKVYLTASDAIRAERRSADLAADPAVTVALTQAEQQRRDRADAAQMAKAPDAVLIDSSALDLDEVISVIEGLARERADAAWSR